MHVSWKILPVYTKLKMPPPSFPPSCHLLLVPARTWMGWFCPWRLPLGPTPQFHGDPCVSSTVYIYRVGHSTTTRVPGTCAAYGRWVFYQPVKSTPAKCARVLLLHNDLLTHYYVPAPAPYICTLIGLYLILSVRVAKKKKMKEEHKRRQANPFTGEGEPQNRWAWADEVKPGEKSRLETSRLPVGRQGLQVVTLGPGVFSFVSSLDCHIFYQNMQF